MVGRGIFFNFDLLGGKSGLFGNPMPQALIPENKSPIFYDLQSNPLIFSNGGCLDALPIS